MSQLDVTAIRSQFPALDRQVDGRPAVYFDGQAGSQVPQCVIDAISEYLSNRNANHGGVFLTSVESDAMLDAAHRAAADFVGAEDPDCVYFGANMTSLTFALSRALASTWTCEDEVIVCRTEHDANFTPWARAAEDAGANLKHVDLRPDDCSLDLDDLARKITPKTALVAVGAASNAVGTIHPLRKIGEMVHAVGGLFFVDAVHYAPHKLIDVTAWNCDFLACSAYKFFGPHVGMMYGKREHLESLPAYRVRPAGAEIPGCWMTGTQNHECIAGALAAIDYLAGLGANGEPEPGLRRESLTAAYLEIVEYERSLGIRMMEGLAKIPAIRTLGITETSRFYERVPTFSITHDSRKPNEIAKYLAERGIFVWSGNFYAQPLSEALELEPDGMVRIGLLHYNTEEEVDRLIEALVELD